MASPDWHQTFAVAVITRGDLTEVGLSQEQIDQLTDADMHALAQKMADYYLDNGYWQHLKEAYRFMREETPDSLDRSRTYEVFSISRFLLCSLGFTNEQIMLLSDTDMQAIADILRDNLLHAAGMDFAEEVRFVTRVFLAEQNGGHT